MAQTLGIVDLVWNGVKYPVKTASLKIGGLVNNPMTAGRQVFSSQQYKEATVEATIPFKRGASLSVFAANITGELQYVCDTGQTYTANDAFVVDTPNLQPGSGKDGGTVKVNWAMSPPLELINQ
jgi:hypothetical protein